MKKLHWLFAGALLLLYWWMATSVSPKLSVAGDEIAHLTAGYSYWLKEDFRLQPENGMLPQRWATLPLLIKKPTFPKLEGTVSWAISDVWQIGFDFFYKSGNDLAAMLGAGRKMIAFWSMALGGLIFLWTRRLAGREGAIVGLILFAFCPLMLSHGALITSDATLSFFLLATLTFWWRLLNRGTLVDLVGSSLCCSLLFLSKFSSVLVIPMAVALAAIRLACCRPLAVPWSNKRVESRPHIAGLLLAELCLIGLITFSSIWAAYAFRFSMFADSNLRPSLPLVTWEGVLSRVGLIPNAIRIVRDHKLLPEGWIYGFGHSWRFAQARPAFLNGETGTSGWWYYFPYATAIKTPLALFFILILAFLGLAVRNRRSPRLVKAQLYATAPLWVLVLVYGIFSLTSHLNIGVRHVMPIFPVMFIFAGSAWNVWRKFPCVRLMIAGFLGWFIVESVHIRPFYLSYFNQLVGGPANGWRHLIDSNVDWGQDLPALRAWISKNASDDEHAHRIYLSYFGSGDPLFYGVTAERFADNYFDLRPRRFPATLGPGTYIVSATMFQRVYTLVRGPWNREREEKYETLLQRAFGSPHLTPSEAELFEHLQFGRLCHWLEQRKPDTMVAYSFLVFHLTQQDLIGALYTPLGTDR